MQPIQININIGLQEETQKVIKEVALAAIYGFLSRAAEASAEIATETAKAAAANAPEAPAGGVAAEAPEKPVKASKAPAKATEPAKPAEAAKPAEISDQTLLDLVKRVKGAKVPAKDIKAIFAKIGIENSTSCPQEKRATLVTMLEGLLPADAIDDLPA